MCDDDEVENDNVVTEENHDQIGLIIISSASKKETEMMRKRTKHYVDNWGSLSSSGQTFEEEGRFTGAYIQVNHGEHFIFLT